MPGAVTACAVGGSIALDAYRPGRSDIDVIAVLSDEWKDHRSLMARLRLLHLAQVPRLTVRAARGLGFSACCNTVFVWQSEISRAVTEIHPVASHVGEVFDSQGAFDVNPVIWKELVDGGISVRGGPVSDWNLDSEPEVLREWSRATSASIGPRWLKAPAAVDAPCQLELWSGAFSDRRECTTPS